MAARVPIKAVVVTSIAPSQDERLRSVTEVALRSFRANGFSTITVNRPDEFERVRSLYPEVTAVHASLGTAFFKARYGPTLGAVFEASAGSTSIGICNSDVVMLTSEIHALLDRQPDTFFAAHRLDVDHIGGDIVGLYRRGVDAVFFNRARFAALLEDADLARFQLGAPLWDIVLPILASFHGPVAFIRPPFILHPVHAARWSKADYRILRRGAVETVIGHAERHAHARPQARIFLELFAQNVGRAGRRMDMLDGGGLKKAMRVFDLWKAKLERGGTVDVRVEIADELNSDALRKLAQPLVDTPTDPEAALESAQNGPFNVRRLRHSAAARLRLWKRRRRNDA